MPDTNKEYGPHKYAGHDGTSDCEFQCGCWMGPTRSGGLLGIDPGGTCPHNPLDGKLLGGKEDYESVVEQRILRLSSRATTAEAKLRAVESDKQELAEELAKTRQDLSKARFRLEQIRGIANKE